MGRMCAIWRKELKSYLSSPIAYIFMFVFLGFTALKYFVLGDARGNFFTKGEAALTDYFATFPYVLAFVVPALCMRLWPEERKTGTIERVCGLFANPEELAFGRDGLPPRPLYRVRFAQTELWSDYQGPAGDAVEVEIYEHWLDPAERDTP